MINLAQLSDDRLAARIADTRAQVKLAQRELNDLVFEQNRRERLANTAKLRAAGIDPDAVSLSDWPCDTSPVSVCVYNDETLNGHDACLFCKEPDERK